jgi:hypothetical protein
MTIEPGTRVRIKDAANLPCAPGDTGTVQEIRHSARDFPIAVKLDGEHIDWFRECEIEPMEGRQ